MELTNSRIRIIEMMAPGQETMKAGQEMMTAGQEMMRAGQEMTDSPLLLVWNFLS